MLTETRFPPRELSEIVTALGSSRCDEALALLLQLAGADGSELKQVGEEWIKAVAALGGPKSKRILLGFLDPEVDVFSIEVSFDNNDCEILASCIADMARVEAGIMQRILWLCDKHLSQTKRSLLASVIARLGTLYAVVAGLSLIEDSVNPSVPYHLREAIKAIFLERRPYGRIENAYTLDPRSFNEIRAKLFEMALKDDRRKESAFALLGQIEVWHVEYGRPITERRHPAFDSGEMWPPLKAAG